MSGENPHLGAISVGAPVLNAPAGVVSSVYVDESGTLQAADAEAIEASGLTAANGVDNALTKASDSWGKSFIERAQQEMGPSRDKMVVRRASDSNSYDVWQRKGLSSEWFRWQLKLDAVQSTNMHSVRAVERWEWFKWQPLADVGTTLSGTWAYAGVGTLANGTQSSGGVLWYATSGTYIERDIVVPEGGDIYAQFYCRTTTGYAYITINGSTELVNLPRSGANAYFDTYSATDTFKPVRIASGLAAGTYTVRITRSTTERNASATQYWIYPDALAAVGAGIGAPYLTNTIQVPLHTSAIVSDISSTQTTQGRTPGANFSSFSTLTFAAATPDYLYFGHNRQFDALILDFATANTNASTATWEYWTGSAWATLTVTDGTVTGGVPLGQDGTVSFSIPSNWAVTTVNGISSHWWVRVKFSADTSAISLTSSRSRLQNLGRRISRMVADGSRIEYAYEVATPGQSKEDVGGEDHGNEALTARTLYLDGGESVEIPPGQAVTCWTFGVIQTHTVSHSVSGTIASGTLGHFWSGNTCRFAWKHTYSATATLKGYAYTAMLPVLWYDGATQLTMFPKGIFFDADMGAVVHDFASLNGLVEDWAPGEANKRGAAGCLFYSPTRQEFMAIVQEDPWRVNNGWAASSRKTWIDVNPSGNSGAFSSRLAKFYQHYLGGVNEIALVNGSVIGGGATIMAGSLIDPAGTFGVTNP